MTPNSNHKCVLTLSHGSLDKGGLLYGFSTYRQIWLLDLYRKPRSSNRLGPIITYVHKVFHHVCNCKEHFLVDYILIHNASLQSFSSRILNKLLKYKTKIWMQSHLLIICHKNAGYNWPQIILLVWSGSLAVSFFNKIEFRILVSTFMIKRMPTTFTWMYMNRIHVI